MTGRLSTGEAAPDYVLLDETGTQVALSQMWASRPALILFLRHFGCLFCREMLKQVQQQAAELRAAGLHIAAVGIGEPKHAAHYRKLLAPAVDCLTDNGATTVYGLYGLRDGAAGAFLNLKVAARTIRALAAGNLIGAPSGNVRMLPGTFIVDTDGIVRYAHYSADVADHPAMTDLVAAGHALHALKV